MPDELFANPRLAVLYDHLQGERDDLDPYIAMVDEFGVRSVLDVGCGTGTLACALADRGVDVIGVDPAAASLEVARTKPRADRVRWILGDATSLPEGAVDLACLTGNAAQVFLTDDSWLATLRGIRRSLRPSGRLVFETRDPADRAWERWSPDASRQRVAIDSLGEVESWHEVTEVAMPLVSFRTTFRFPDGEEMSSASTLRFRDDEEIRVSLASAGFEVAERRGAPDRPGREFVYVAVAAA